MAPVRRRPDGLAKLIRSFAASAHGASSTNAQFVVTATQTITNDDYRVTADGNLSAVGEVPAVTYVGQPVTKYYYLGSTRVAMRKGGAVYYLHGDHLGSTSLTTDATGAIVAQSRYLPYGQERWTDGPAQTDFTFTGQRNDLYTHLIEMDARWYDPYLNRWISADSIVPQASNPQNLNRYSYVLDNPLRHIDPSGHCIPEFNCPGDRRNTQPLISTPTPTPASAWTSAPTPEAAPTPPSTTPTPVPLGTPCPSCGAQALATPTPPRGVPVPPGVALYPEGELPKFPDIDMVGTRGDVSGYFGIAGIGIGADINLDLVYFTQSKQLGLFITPGSQNAYAGEGLEWTAGPLLGTDISNSASYSGASWTPGGADITFPPVNVEVEASANITQNPDGTLPKLLYFGFSPTGPGGEAEGYYQVIGNTFELGHLSFR
jgi:RHS repeat-associated protein